MSHDAPRTAEYAWPLAWVERTTSVLAFDPAKEAIEDNDGWHLLHVGNDPNGQTMLTYGWGTP